MTILAAHKRGDTFSYSMTLANGWVGDDFDGGMKFTLRTELPPSSTVTDDDAVDQATSAAGEITWVAEVVTVKIPASRTTAWPRKTLYWDCCGIVIASPENEVYTIDSGTIPIDADVTRSA
jgi:hypothetical protein